MKAMNLQQPPSITQLSPSANALSRSTTTLRRFTNTIKKRVTEHHAPNSPELRGSKIPKLLTEATTEPADAMRKGKRKRKSKSRQRKHDLEPPARDGEATGTVENAGRIGTALSKDIDPLAFHSPAKAKNALRQKLRSANPVGCRRSRLALRKNGDHKQPLGNAPLCVQGVLVNSVLKNYEPIGRTLLPSQQDQPKSTVKFLEVEGNTVDRDRQHL